QLEYDLTITRCSKIHVDKYEAAHKTCICRIFSNSSRLSTCITSYLLKLPTIHECINILQAKFLLQSNSLPDDAPLIYLLPHLQRHNS
ncbi:uncharacterized protein BX663DRAFT_435546, partial [Cokeromyces recurvatus]|uniref:uncharacterized protein n=1 Tax=Cokeromyces recurvatus TaxID=90255 RepID=UPI002220044C